MLLLVFSGAGPVRSRSSVPLDRCNGDGFGGPSDETAKPETLHKKYHPCLRCHC